MPKTWLILFDLDGTLAPVGEPIPAAVCRQLTKLQDAGHILAICSGKPLYYLTGLVRQAGLEDFWLIGENGATLQWGAQLPPQYFQILLTDAAIEKQLQALKVAARHQFKTDVWFQPNDVCCTLFFKQASLREQMGKWLKAYLNKHPFLDLEVVEHADSFDISPVGMNKGTALYSLKRQLKELGIALAGTIAVGDHWNDVPMLQAADVGYLLPGDVAKQEPKGVHLVASLDEAFQLMWEQMLS